MNYNIEKLKNDTTKIIIKNKYFNIDSIYRSGQAFTIYKSDNKYTIISKDKLCVIKKDINETYIYVKSKDIDYWIDYFNFKIPFDKYLEIMKNYDNDFIKKCANYSKGLVILKQDLWETMISFIISQRKSIPSIFTSIERIRKNFGTTNKIYLEEIGDIVFESLPHPSDFIWGKNIDNTINILKENKTTKSKKLKECGLGYRDEYILYAANWYNLTSEAINSLYDKSYNEHMKALLEIRGIGNKVANCICLFAFNDLDAFPIDVWIQRLLEKNLIPEDLSDFNGYKGFLQQIIFFYIINNKDFLS